MSGCRYLIPAALLVAAASLPASAEVASWKFIETVGGLAIGPPLKASSGWLLPIHSDVSGFTKITVAPKTLNSALTCAETIVQVEKSAIFISVATSIPGGGRSVHCPPAELRQIAAGRYSVTYRARGGPDVKLGSIVITP